MTNPKTLAINQFEEGSRQKYKQDRSTYTADNDFKINTITIKSPSGGEVDVIDIYTGVSIYEDLFSNTISISLSINDTNDIAKHLPIIGQREKIEIEFSMPGSEILKLEFDIYKVDVKQFSTVGKKQAMVMKGVSSEQFNNIHTRVSQSFFGTIDETIITIFNNYVREEGASGKQHKLNVEAKTNSEKRKFIIPNWHPFHAINWLVERAVAEEKSTACNYVFYQDRNGFHLNTIDALYDVDKPRQEYFYLPRSFREAPLQHRDPGYEMRNVQKLIFAEPGDRLEENIRGMYGSKILTHDIVRKEYAFKNYSLSQRFGDTNHAESNYPIAQGIDAFSNKANTHFNFCPIHKNLNQKNELYGGETVEQNEKYAEWLLSRNSQLRQVGTNVITINVSGDSRRAPGDVVSLTVTPLQPADGKDMQFDKYICGKYMVTSIKHNVTPDGYWMDMELCKDSNAEAYPAQSNFLGSQDEQQQPTISG